MKFQRKVKNTELTRFLKSETHFTIYVIYILLMKHDESSQISKC